ncbi:hypothetical protein Z950_176 [Sulfitobacter mediterraneus KCTC 32188]|nr:hypothetical protein Z950_176 [Sulfitobacter mediterraneus KCTC 32188]
MYACFKQLAHGELRKSHVFIPFRFSLIGGMTADAANRRTFEDFSPKGPTPTAGSSAARIDQHPVKCKGPWAQS